MRVRKWLVIAALVAAAVPAAAQEEEKRVNLNIGGGFTFATGTVRDHLGDGYNFNIGLIFNVKPALGFQVEYGFSGLGSKKISIPVSPLPGDAPVSTNFYGDMNMQFVDFNLVVKPPMQRAVKPYAMVGVGYYYRPVKVTTPSVGYVPGYCDPWWYVCYPGGWVPTTTIVGQRSSSDVGMNVGGGVAFPIGGGASGYVEARYHYIWGPTITNASTGVSQKANGTFFPITFGIRF